MENWSNRLRWNNKLNIWRTVKYVVVATVFNIFSALCCNSARWRLYFWLSSSHWTSRFPNEKAENKMCATERERKRNKIHTNNCENGIECFKMAEEFRNAERKRTLLNKTKIVCRRNGMCQRSQYKTSARRQSFYLSNSFFRLLFCVGCWRVFHSLSLCVCVFRNFLDCLFSIGST